MDRTRKGHTMKRIAIIIGIAAAIGVFPSVAAAGNITAQLITAKPASPAKRSAQIARPQVARVQIANAQRANPARLNALSASLKRLALYPH
jgi:hypothetical protein